MIPACSQTLVNHHPKVVTSAFHNIFTVIIDLLVVKSKEDLLLAAFLVKYIYQTLLAHLPYSPTKSMRSTCSYLHALAHNLRYAILAPFHLWFLSLEDKNASFFEKNTWRTQERHRIFKEDNIRKQKTFKFWNDDVSVVPLINDDVMEIVKLVTDNIDVVITPEAVDKFAQWDDIYILYWVAHVVQCRDHTYDTFSESNKKLRRNKKYIVPSTHRLWTLSQAFVIFGDC